MENRLSFGVELEISDVLKSTPIPEELGQWEQSELDIVNTLGQWEGICADPRGELVPVGGEINTTPTRKWRDQLKVINSIISLFPNPQVGLTSHLHVHVHIERLSVSEVKKLLVYFRENQEEIIQSCHKTKQIPKGKEWGKIRNYLNWDGARRIPDWFVGNVLLCEDSYDSLQKTFKLGKASPKKEIRTQRYFINFHSLFNSRTIEFRFFRGSLDSHEIESCLMFCNELVLAGLQDEKPVSEILSERNYNFPTLVWNTNQAKGWVGSRFNSSRCLSKNREFIQC